MVSITNISAHPRFTQARAPRFGHDNGRIVQRSTWGLEALRLEDVFTLSQELQQAARGTGFDAVQARVDFALLRDAWRRYRDFWSVVRPDQFQHEGTVA